MNREYHKWYSSRLGRDMELLVFGHSGLPVMVFPTSGGRFYEFEDRGMIGAVGSQVEAGHLQFYCVDSVDMESWYNRNVPPRWRIARHVQYEDYLIHEVVPLVRQKNRDPHFVSLGCSFGGYHATNIALRHPDVFTGLLSMSGAFDMSNFLGGYYDQDCYFNLPTHYSAEPQRSLVLRALSPQHLHSWDGLGRSVSGAEPEFGPHYERQGHSPQALHVGDMELARLAHMAGDDSRIFVGTWTVNGEDRGASYRGEIICKVRRSFAHYGY